MGGIIDAKPHFYWGMSDFFAMKLSKGAVCFMKWVGRAIGVRPTHAKFL